MNMPWLLVLSLSVGVLSTQEARHYRRHQQWSQASRDAWLLVLLGWFPLVAWILNALWPQF